MTLCKHSTSYCCRSSGYLRAICTILAMAARQLEFASGSWVVEGNSSRSRWTDAWNTAGRSRVAIWAGLREENVWRIFSASLVSSKRRFCLQATTGLAARHISSQRLPGACILPLKRPKWWIKVIVFIFYYNWNYVALVHIKSKARKNLYSYIWNKKKLLTEKRKLTVFNLSCIQSFVFKIMRLDYVITLRIFLTNYCW